MGHLELSTSGQIFGNAYIIHITSFLFISLLCNGKDSSVLLHIFIWVEALLAMVKSMINAHLVWFNEELGVMSLMLLNKIVEVLMHYGLVTIN